MDEYKYIGKEMILDVIKARGRYLGDAEIMNSMDKTALDQIEGYKKALDSIAEDVKNIPPVNVQPVKHGRWIIADDVEHFIAVCSECGRTEDSRGIKDMPYCHCGTRMDGDAE